LASAVCVPDVGEKGPLAVYRQIQLALDQVGHKAAAIPFLAIGPTSRAP
jgi:hypothetical protein